MSEKRERPGAQKPLNLQAVEGMASTGATNVDIADFLGVSESLVRRKGAEALRRGRARLRIKLRQKQVQVAEKGNPTMLIWLGKQYLGQTDHRTITFDDLNKLSDAELAAIAAGKLPDK